MWADTVIVCVCVWDEYIKISVVDVVDDENDERVRDDQSGNQINFIIIGRYKLGENYWWWTYYGTYCRINHNQIVCVE